MVAERLRRVRERIAAAAREAGRDPAEVTLLVVSKGRSDAAVRAAYAAGVRDFGENRAEELQARHRAGLPEDVRWHFVGPVQRRKVRVIAPGLHLLHSLDRLRLAATWARLEAPPPVLVEVNVGMEPQKHGFLPETVLDAVGEVRALGIEVRGLMAIPPRPRRPEDSRPFFVRLRELRDEVRRVFPEVTELSMGMTDDFPVAVACGATIVRLGRAIFGPASTEPPRPRPDAR